MSSGNSRLKPKKSEILVNLGIEGLVTKCRNVRCGATLPKKHWRIDLPHPKYGVIPCDFCNTCTLKFKKKKIVSFCGVPVSGFGVQMIPREKSVLPELAMMPDGEDFLKACRQGQIVSPVKREPRLSGIMTLNEKPMEMMDVEV